MAQAECSYGYACPFMGCTFTTHDVNVLEFHAQRCPWDVERVQMPSIPCLSFLVFKSTTVKLLIVAGAERRLGVPLLEALR